MTELQRVNVALTTHVRELQERLDLLHKTLSQPMRVERLTSKTALRHLLAFPVRVVRRLARKHRTEI